MTLPTAGVELDVMVARLRIDVAQKLDPNVVAHLSGELHRAALRCNDLARCDGERNEGDSVIV